jgi:hypothetical protein
MWVCAVITLVLFPLCLTADDKSSARDDRSLLTVTNRWEDPITFTAEEIAKLPHTEFQAGKDKSHYSGVPLAEFLRLSGVIWEGKCSPLLTCYVLVEGSDGYRVIFSIPEIDPGQCHKMVLVADRRDGKPLTNAEGPYETIEEDAKQHGRWVRHVNKVTLVQALPRPRPKRDVDATKKTDPPVATKER